MPPLLDWRLLKLSDGLTGLMLQVLQMRGHINKSGSHVLLWNQSINLCSYVYYPSTFLAVYQSRTSSDRGDLHQNQSNTNLTFKSDCGPKSYCGLQRLARGLHLQSFLDFSLVSWLPVCGDRWWERDWNKSAVCEKGGATEWLWCKEQQWEGSRKITVRCGGTRTRHET